jgi:hypothetical protein
MTKMKTAVAGLAALVALAVLPAGAGAVADGKQVAPHTVVFPRDGVTVTVTGTRSASGLAECKRGYACLWMHSGYRGYIARFYHYGTYQLADYGLPRFSGRGASSYYNHQTGGARAILHADFDFSMRGHGNLYGALNDRAKSITLAR